MNAFVDDIPHISIFTRFHGESERPLVGLEISNQTVRQLSVDDSHDALQLLRRMVYAKIIVSMPPEGATEAGRTCGGHDEDLRGVRIDG